MKIQCARCKVALGVSRNGDSAEGVQQLVSLLKDALLHMPASSVNVEKLHATTQESALAHRSGKSVKALQLHTYVTSTRLEHARLKGYVEQEIFGKSKIRLGRLLSNRVVKRSLPARTMTRVRAKTAAASRRTSLSHLGCFIPEVLRISRQRADPNPEVRGMDFQGVSSGQQLAWSMIAKL